MAREWFYRDKNAELGPYGPSEMRMFADSGQITAGTPVRKGAEGKWVPALQVKGLIPTPEVKPGASIAPTGAPSLPQQPTSTPSLPRRESVSSPPDAIPRATTVLWTPSVIIGLGAIAAVFLLLLSVSIIWLVMARTPTAPQQNSVAAPAQKETDPLEEFKQLATRLSNTEPAHIIIEHGVGKSAATGRAWERQLRMWTEFSLDAKKTDSLVSPYTGQVGFTELRFTYLNADGRPEFASRAEAESATSFRVSRIGKLGEYAWRNGSWEITNNVEDGHYGKFAPFTSNHGWGELGSDGTSQFTSPNGNIHRCYKVALPRTLPSPADAKEW